MTTSTLDTFTRQTSSRAIAFYQLWISPHKGFVCAHRVLHRGESCSQYAKRTILEQGLWTAIPLMQERFEDCRVANEILKARRSRWERLQHRSMAIASGEPTPDPNTTPDTGVEIPDMAAVIPEMAVGATVLPKRRPCQENTCRTSDCQNANCSDALDCLEVLGDGTDCLSDCSNYDWNGFDCGNLDCGSSDCSSLDCGSLDCGSCG